MNRTTDPYIALAQDTIEAWILNKELPELPADLPAELTKDRSGVFVSLHREGELRGCIGTIEATQDSIAEEIQANAISASTRDPRFPALQASELDDLEVSVDVLGEKERISGLDDLDVDRYGVIVEKGYRRGLLLPRLDGVDNPLFQVAIALQKAGIQLDEDYTLYRFEVIRHEDED